MAQQVVWYNVHVRGAGDTFDEANAEALGRLESASNRLVDGRLPNDPGIRIATDDPGGGGGPCAAEYIKIEVNVSASGLPEAQSDDDD